MLSVYTILQQALLMSYQAKKLFQDNELAKRYSKFRYVFPKKLVSEIMKLLDNKKPCL